MAIIVTKGISQDGKTLYITDATTDYGVGLPLRAEMALLIYIVYKASTGDQVIAAEAYAPDDVLTFSIDVENKDGVYDIYVFAIKRLLEQVLVEGDIVYVDADNKIKKYVSAVLSEITLASLIDEEVGQTLTDALITTQVTILKDTLELAYLEKLEAYDGHICDFNELQVAKRNFDYTRALRSGAIIEKCSGHPIAAQLKIETAIEFATKAIG